ncbi:hypothetical protein ZIOFF_064159 [Zingiber officinale]|uniref:NAC domain-containing protein n=1 Tax=Zingiber officinale TaxID=94328 RepID=A0A8J5CI17_ZINOF|nr:hypothetical protein ZIOFF_064159 [Zingiber officinale]
MQTSDLCLLHTPFLLYKLLISRLFFHNLIPIPAFQTKNYSSALQNSQFTTEFHENYDLGLQGSYSLELLSRKSDHKVQKLDAMLPPGFRFHPTDEELVGYYLKRKIDGLNIELEVIPVIDLYKFDPWELPEKSFLPKRDMEWFFFCPRDRKYPNGSRTNRATVSGYWKATGKDRKIECECAVFGLRKTLVFYVGRAPGGERTDWIMHEYRLCEDLFHGSSNFLGAFALCHVVKRNANWLKSGDPNGESKAQRNLIASSSRKRDYDNFLNDTDENLSLELLNGSSGSSTITSSESAELHPSLPQTSDMGNISDAPKTTSVPLEMNHTEEAYECLSPFPSPVHCMEMYNTWEDITFQEKSFLPKRDMEWFFFCPRDRKYPNGSRTNRATVSGYWKATGKDRKIECECAVFGLRKTLVFYVGRAPGGERTDWIMHEYRLCEDLFHGSSNFLGAFALCHVVKRNANWLKSGDPNGESKAQRNLIASSSRKRDYDNFLNDTDENLSLELLNGSSGSSTITSPESVELHPSLPQTSEMGIISDASKTTSVPLEMNHTEEAYECLSPFPSPVHFMEMYNTWEDITFQGWNSTEFIDISCSGINYYYYGYSNSHVFMTSHLLPSKLLYIYIITGGDVFSVMRSPPICRQASEEEEDNLWLQEDNTLVTVM